METSQRPRINYGCSTVLLPAPPFAADAAGSLSEVCTRMGMFTVQSTQIYFIHIIFIKISVAGLFLYRKLVIQDVFQPAAHCLIYADPQILHIVPNLKKGTCFQLTTVFNFVFPSSD